MVSVNQESLMIRKAIAVDKLAIGEILGQDLYDQDNQLLLRKGTVLLNTLVEAFRERELRHVYIRAEAGSLLAGSEGEACGVIAGHVGAGKSPGAGCDSSRSSASSGFSTLYSRIVHEMSRARLRGQYNKVLPSALPELAARLAEMVTALDEAQAIALFLQVKQHIPGSPEGHAANSAYLAAALGHWSGCPEDAIRDLALSGLLHDIGDSQIPEAIYARNSRLSESEWNVVKTHPLLGAQIVNKSRWATDNVINGILWHHERLDGSGYPSGLAGDGIPGIARIVATACAFDAMTSERPYRRAMSLFQALALLKQLSFGQLDALFTRLLHEKILEYFRGQKVEMCNGERGTIVGIVSVSDVSAGRKLLVQGEWASYDMYLQESPAIRCILNT